jgi:hypothetical protein
MYNKVVCRVRYVLIEIWHHKGDESVTVGNIAITASKGNEVMCDDDREECLQVQQKVECGSVRTWRESAR